MRKNIKRVFIAGGTGFLGYYAGLEFLSRGIAVSTIALPNEIDVSGWFPKEISLAYGNLFEMTYEELIALFSNQEYDAIIYALGPDERFVPQGKAYPFFYEKLVTNAKRILSAAKSSGINRAVVLNSYFSYFDRVYKGQLSKKHPYIHARVEQEKELATLGTDGTFDVMFLELPYIFGTMPQRTPLWKDYFLKYFDRSKVIFFPFGGGTTAVDVKDVARAIMAATINGENDGKYQIGEMNISYRNMLKIMMDAKGTPKPFIGVLPILAAMGAAKLDAKMKKEGKESGLDHYWLMLQIQNHKFFIDSNKYKKELRYDELGIISAENVVDSIQKTIIRCYEEPKKGQGPNKS